MFYLSLYLLALTLTSICALRWGGRAEHLGAAAVVVGGVATVLVSTGDPTAGAEYGIIAVDTVLLLVLLGLALRSDRFWPMWSTAFHLMSMTVHLTKVVDPTVARLPYLHANAFWAYPMLLALAVGAWREGPRGRRVRAPDAWF